MKKELLLKRLFIALLFQTFCITVAFGQSAGFDSTYIVLRINGGGNTYYDLQATTSNPDFNGTNLGTFCQGSSGIVFKGAEHNNYKCGSCNITSTRIYYRIYLTGSPSGSFVTNNIGWASGSNNGCGGQNQRWATTGYSTNLTGSLSPGNYTIEVYSDQSTSCSGTQYASNGGSNYKATFTINANVTYYVDNDNDGFGSSASSVVTCTGAPIGYVANSSDTNDNLTTYVDFDGDGFGSNVKAPSGVTNNLDSNDNLLTYVDNDGDGFGQNTYAPNGPINNSDCNDNQLQYQDLDGDGFGSNVLVACGVANNSDCNDNQLQYVDNDGDGFGSLTLAACGVTNNTDCDDNDNTKHATFSFYLDSDGDGVGFGALVSGVCAVDANTPPVGYSLTNTDCAPNDGLAYQTGMFYTDADGDNYSLDNSQVSLCYGATEPNGYSAVSLGIDCNDSVSAINPGMTEILYDGFDNNCNGLLDEGNQLIANMTNCGTTLATIGSLISCVSTAGVDGYRFEVTNTVTNAVQTIDRPLQYFNLTQLSSFEYATTYSVRVMLRKNGIWLGYYGPSCLYSTPPVTQPTGGTGTTQLQTYCGQTLPSISTLIATTSLPGATGYRFRVTNTVTGSVQTLTRTLHWFSLTMLPSYNYGTTYVVDVAVKTTGDYSEYGAPCNVTTPNVPTLVNYCGGAIVPTKGTNIYTSSLDRVTSYRFEVTRYTDETLSTPVDVSQVDRNINWFTFNMVSNYSANTH